MEVKPNETFYRVADIGNSDGTIDAKNMMGECFETPEEALEHIKEQAQEGLAGVVYECRPVYIARPGKVRVTKLS
jgi:hypothetical protein